LLGDPATFVRDNATYTKIISLAPFLEELSVILNDMAAILDDILNFTPSARDPD